ncbi:L-threonine dehydratase catabolic TdcB [Klebsiella michiganensis]|uniref:L-threonine dehydratase catabolic TdcB n=1 Tax=Klebsiella michiganensis TaxID=1134687 RepID=A0A7H4PRD9_9ENTR|nr:L-threonine dehydratase catabolic TdcB [Klebsiella michiganensis]
MANNVSSDIDIAEFYAARERIYPLALATPLIYSRSLSDLFSAQIYLKCEQFQPTGAFKIRGAANTILGELQKNEQRIRRNGVVTASTGKPRASRFLCGEKAGDPGDGLSFFSGAGK